jgi:hypothetical protein
MKTKFIFGCTLLFCCLSPGLRAQDTAFWFVAPHMTEKVHGGLPSNFPAFLAISNGTYQTAHVVITLYNGGSTLTIPATIPPGSLYKHDFDNAVKIKQIENPRGSAGAVTTYGTHISSDVKVTAYYMQNQRNSKDIFTLKGHQALGTLFYVPMQSDNAAPTNNIGYWVGACDQIDIVATEDNTEVTVIPTEPVFNVGPGSNPSPAGTSIVRKLNKGQTLKIMESTVNLIPSLAGTLITSNNPVAVTVTEDMVGTGDTSGDQIVPVGSLGTRYVVPRGYRTDPNLERFYLVATAANTTVKVYDNGSNYTPITLSAAGAATRYTFPSTANAVYVESTAPVSIYHRSGTSEEGAALIPSLYAIGQNQVIYYQIGEGVTERKGVLVFRSGTESSFTISYGSTNTVLNVGTPYPVPNVADWKVARFDLPGDADDKVVTIRNELSPFSFGYITGYGYNVSYGYFSAFGTFEFPAITYMCGSSVVLHGGYAENYTWTFPDGHTETGASSITATQEGVYTLVMTSQGLGPVIASTTVQKVNAGVINLGEQVICTGETPAPLSVTGASELQGTQYQWQFSLDNVNWTNIGGATSSTYQPGALTQTTWYRRGMTSDFCAMAYTYGAKVRISSCVLPVNPHLMGRYRGN